MKITLSLPCFLFIITCLTVHFSCSSSRSSGPLRRDGYQSIFDGTLEGWTYDPVYWRVEKGILVGEVTPSTLLKRNSFIIKRNLVTRDFDLTVEFRISARGNSGINYRSEVIDTLPYAMRGYQADIDGPNRYTGQNYEERGRTTLAYRGEKVIIGKTISTLLPENIKNNAWMNRIVTATLGNSDSLIKQVRKDDWNQCHLIVKGNRLQHFINGVLMSDVTDNDTHNRKISGSLGVQLHVGPPMKIEYRNFRFKHL